MAANDDDDDDEEDHDDDKGDVRRTGRTGMRYHGNQIVCARRIHVRRTNDGPLAVRSGMGRSRKKRGRDKPSIAE